MLRQLQLLRDKVLQRLAICTTLMTGRHKAAREGGVPVITGVILANTIIQKAMSEPGANVTPMKLQKLLYFTCKEYYRLTGESLFSEPFEVWQYGPVLPSVYAEFSSFGGSEITRFATDSQGKVSIVDEDSSEDLKNAIATVWDKYKRVSGPVLSGMTHRTGTAWSIANVKRCSTITEDDIRREIANDEYPG